MRRQGLHIPDKFRVDVERCPRCEARHLHVLFERFRYTSPGCFTHWSRCPMTGEPIMIRSPNVADDCYEGPIVENLRDDEDELP